MKKSDFTYILQNPQRISNQQINALNDIIDKYPYFQSARALHLKGLKTIGSHQYNAALKTTAAHTTDRSILFDFVTSKVFNQNEISQVIKQNSEHIKDITVNDIEDISVNKSITIDDALKQHIKNTEGVLDPNLFEEKINQEEIAHFLSLQNNSSKKVTVAVDLKNIEENPEDILHIGTPLEFDKKETHSFTEWLKITSFKRIQRDETNDDVSKIIVKNDENTIKDKKVDINSKFDLIDKFLENKPKIIPSKDSRKIETNHSNKAVQDGLMTETLARIYLEQHNYEKAIQSYKILSLKYPEKSGFFADQIKAIKKLQENNTEK